MPIAPQTIGSTNPKSGTYQWSTKRIQGLPLVIPDDAGDTEVTNRRIVSIQQDAEFNMFAVISRTALASHIIIGWGVLEQALQSGGINSIAPDVNTFVDGDLVTVLSDVDDVYQIDVDGSNDPINGINTAYLDSLGRITSVSSGGNLALLGSVFQAVPGNQLSGQLTDGCVFYKLYTPLKP